MSTPNSPQSPHYTEPIATTTAATDAPLSGLPDANNANNADNNSDFVPVSWNDIDWSYFLNTPMQGPPLVPASFSPSSAAASPGSDFGHSATPPAIVPDVQEPPQQQPLARLKGEEVEVPDQITVDWMEFFNPGAPRITTNMNALDPHASNDISNSTDATTLLDSLLSRPPSANKPEPMFWPPSPFAKDNIRPGPKDPYGSDGDYCKILRGGRTWKLVLYQLIRRVEARGERTEVRALRAQLKVDYPVMYKYFVENAMNWQSNMSSELTACSAFVTIGKAWSILPQFEDEEMKNLARLCGMVPLSNTVINKTAPDSTDEDRNCSRVKRGQQARSEAVRGPTSQQGRPMRFIVETPTTFSSHTKRPYRRAVNKSS